MKNITDQVQRFPIRVTVPDPVLPELRDRVAVTNVQMWRDGKRQNLSLTQAETSFRRDLAAGSGSATFNIGEIEVHPDEKIEFTFSYRMAKGVDDAEVLQSMYASDSLRISVVDYGQQPRSIRVNAIHPDPIEHLASEEDGKAHNYRINRYLMPHHGAVLYWRPLSFPEWSGHIRPRVAG
jgi:hypothetical protein